MDILHSVGQGTSGQVSALEGVFVAKKEAWQLADDLSDSPELKEHMFPVMFKRQDRHLYYDGRSLF